MSPPTKIACLEMGAGNAGYVAGLAFPNEHASLITRMKSRNQISDVTI
jgi:hypothetical protein